MTVFDLLTMIGGLCLFLFGMNIMGQALERRAGGKLKTVLGKLTTNKSAGLLTGLGVTSVIQSSSATTVMVVGFVNSGLMTLKQAINVIMGANIGTTVTAWILSLGGIQSDNVWVKLLQPMSFTPILALIGTVFFMFCKNDKKKDTGLILLGFTALMFGMDIMTGAVSGLAESEAFCNLFLMFTNPILGVLVGAVLTAIIQSSSASVGILQALTTTGQVTYGAAIPIIMGQNIGTCITAILSSFGTNKNAKRAAMVHLSFNVIGTVVLLSVFCAVKAIFNPAILGETANHAGIAIAHSAFNILCTCMLFPASSLLEKLAYKLVPDSKGDTPEKTEQLDERLLSTPSVAIGRCHEIALEMANTSVTALYESLAAVDSYSPQKTASVREKESRTDKYEDLIGSYLVKLSQKQISEEDSHEAGKLLKLIGDLERIADHALNIAESAEELHEKKIVFTNDAKAEFAVLSEAVREILSLALLSYKENSVTKALDVEPLEQVIDKLKEGMRSTHIIRMQQNECTIEGGFIWVDLLTELERTADHCSNIAGCIIDSAKGDLNLHKSLREMKQESKYYKEKYLKYEEKYRLRAVTQS